MSTAIWAVHLKASGLPNRGFGCSFRGSYRAALLPALPGFSL